MSPLTIFSWGYDGWGNATRQLKRAVDAVEKSRNFEPPLFVDIRFSRGGRAEGFKGSAFENLVGHDRYLWMNDLGNRSIKTGAQRISISNPRAAELLLTLAIENDRRPRRIIFFCSCGWPRYDKHVCHRVIVAGLLLEAAKRRRTSIEVVEWPGGKISEVAINLSLDELKRMRKAASVRLGRMLPETSLLGLPWGSLVKVSNAPDPFAFFSGAAQYWAGRWVLQSLRDGLETPESKGRGLPAGDEWRKKWGFASRTSTRN